MSRAEDLFALERALRAAALDFATWEKATNRLDGIDGARRRLREAAIAYAKLEADLEAAESERWKSIEEKGKR